MLSSAHQISAAIKTYIADSQTTHSYSVFQVDEPEPLQDLLIDFFAAYQAKQLLLQNKSLQLTSQHSEASQVHLQLCARIEECRSRYADLLAQREQVQNSLFQQESELALIEKRIENQCVDLLPLRQQLADIQKGKQICQERLLPLQEENAELFKDFSYLKSFNEKLRQRLHQLQIKLHEQQQERLFHETQSKNQLLIRKLKIVNDLRFFLKRESAQPTQGGQQKRPRIRGSPLFSQEDAQYLEDSYNNFDSLNVDSRFVALIESELADSLGNILQLKSELEKVNDETNSQSSKKVTPVRFSHNSRYRTHHDLGRRHDKADMSAINRRLDQIKIYTENSDDESRPQGQGELKEATHDLSRSQNQSSQKEPQYKGLSKPISFNHSFNSVSHSSLSSQRRLGALTLRDELTFAQLQEVEDESTRHLTGERSSQKLYYVPEPSGLELGDLGFVRNTPKKSPRKQLKVRFPDSGNGSKFSKTKIFGASAVAAVIGVGGYLLYRKLQGCQGN